MSYIAIDNSRGPYKYPSGIKCGFYYRTNKKGTKYKSVMFFISLDIAEKIGVATGNKVELVINNEDLSHIIIRKSFDKSFFTLNKSKTHWLYFCVSINKFREYESIFNYFLEYKSTKLMDYSVKNECIYINIPLTVNNTNCKYKIESVGNILGVWEPDNNLGISKLECKLNEDIS